MTLYEINKQAYNKLPNLSAEECDELKGLVETYLINHPAKYYMCLNNENHYYTVYTHQDNDNRNYKKLAYEMVEIANELGGIKAIELSNDGGAIEFWIMYDNIDTCVFYLFPYDQGVVEV